MSQERLEPAEPRGLPLGAHIILLCAGVTLPLLLLSAFLLYDGARAARARLEDEANRKVRDLALLIERDLASTAGMLQALATNPFLLEGDLEAFDRRVRLLPLAHQGSLMVRDLSGRQLVNTLVPLGAPLPQGTDIADTDRRAIASGRPQVSGLLIDAVAQTPMVLLEVPVYRDGAVVYFLGICLPAAHLGEMLDALTLPEGWWATIIDSTGTIIARSLQPGHTIGMKVLPAAQQAIARAGPASQTVMVSPEGIANFASFHRVGLAGWTAALAVPEEVLLRPLYRSLRWIGLLGAVAVIASAALGLVHGSFIARGVRALTRAALALGHGQPLPPVASLVRDLNAAGQALRAAGRELACRAREREDLLKTLGRSPAVVRDPGGRISFWGSGAERLYGYGTAEALGRVCHDLLATRFPRPLAEIDAALLEHDAWEGEVQHRTKSGAWLTVASHWVLRRDPATGQPLAVVETNTDLTAKIEAERQIIAAKAAAEAANAGKTALLTTITHDLRQPFQALRLFHEELGLHAGPGQARLIECMDKALTSGEELLATLVDLSVVETGRLEPQPALFPIGDLLAEIAAECGPLAKAAGLRLRLVRSSAWVITDRGLLRRMIRNLVVNALRYTRGGGVVLGCRHRSGALLVQVADSGIGIPADKLNRIFEEFYRVDMASGGRGLGLGLAIVSRLGALLGHPVTVESRLGKGSVFSIEMKGDGIAAPAGREVPEADPISHAERI